MSLQDGHSCECMRSELDIFSTPPTQTSLENGSWEKYHPIATLTDGGPIEFYLPGDGDQYLDLANVQLYVRARIVQPDGAAPDAASHPGPVNLWLHSLFEEVDVTLGDNVLTTATNTYPFRAMIETLLSHSDEAKSTQLGMALWRKDTAHHMDTRSCAPGSNNEGLVARGSRTMLGASVEMAGRLHCDIFSQERLLLNQVPLKLRLIRSRDSFSLMSPNDIQYKVNIQEVFLLARYVNVSPSIQVAQEKALRVGPAKYPVKRVECKYFTIPRGNTTANQENLFTGQMPTRVIVTCLDSDAFNGSYRKNPFNFKHKDLSMIQLHVGGMKDTIKPLTPRYPDQCLLSFLSVFTGTGKWGKDIGCGFSRDEYPGGYAIYAWDLTADLSEGDHFQLLRNSNIRLELKFRTPLTVPTIVLIYAEFENMIMIDGNRNVTTNYRL